MANGNAREQQGFGMRTPGDGARHETGEGGFRDPFSGRLGPSHARGASSGQPLHAHCTRGLSADLSEPQLDTRILEDIQERLMNAWMDSSDVAVEVEDGEVTLHGLVDTSDEQRAVEDMVAGVPGVREVHSYLAVDAPHRLLLQREDRQVDASRH